MIPQLGDHFHPGPAGFLDRRSRHPRGALFGNHAEIVMQAARTRQPTIGDALAVILRNDQRATQACVASYTIEHARRYDWPILALGIAVGKR